MIPKIIHYCWYGRGEFSPLIKRCIQSWKDYCPDYQIKRWDEDNSPMEIEWIRDAYRHQKYAFIADYMRFYALFREGGIYLDTDMLLVRTLDGLLKDGLFLGREDAYNASMGIIGAESGNSFCRMCLDNYDSIKFNMVSPPIITRLITPELIRFGFKEVDITQKLSNGLVVYKSDVFYPIHYSQSFNLGTELSYVKKDTIGVHLWNKSWLDEFAILQNGNYRQGFMLVWKRFLRTPCLPLKYWGKVIKYVGNYIGLWKK